METICLGNKIASNLKLIFYFIYNFLFFKTVPTQTNILTSLIQELVELIKDHRCLWKITVFYSKASVWSIGFGNLSWQYRLDVLMLHRSLLLTYQKKKNRLILFWRDDEATMKNAASFSKKIFQWTNWNSQDIIFP